VLLLGCGRLDFDSGGAAACGHSLAPPTSVTVSGHAFTSSYTTDTGPLSDVPVAVHAFDDPAVLASSKSDENGAYSLSVATGGVTRELVVDFTPLGYLPSTVYTGATVDRNTVVDGPIWDGGSMASVYGAAVVPAPDPARGTLAIGVYKCDGTPFTGATVTIGPRPEGLNYIGDDGHPSSQTSIGTVHPFAFGFNAPVGPTTVGALAPGARFTAQLVDVTADATAGGHVTVVFLYPDAD
jgi:hypothetical protein